MLTRAGARAGDDLYVTGALGGAAPGLQRASCEPGAAGRPPSIAIDGRSHVLRFGLLLGRNRAARACIDLSDGLADGVRQLGEASGLGAIIDGGAVPIEEGVDLHDALSGRRRLRAPVCGLTQNCARA